MEGSYCKKVNESIFIDTEVETKSLEIAYKNAVEDRRVLSMELSKVRRCLHCHEAFLRRSGCLPKSTPSIEIPGFGVMENWYVAEEFCLMRKKIEILEAKLHEIRGREFCNQPEDMMQLEVQVIQCQTRRCSWDL